MPKELRHHERLGVPPRWWTLGLLFVASIWLVLVSALPEGVAWAGAAAAAIALTTVFVSYGGARVQVADGKFRAGRAHIAVELLGPVTPLNPSATRLLAGPDADARAYLLLRPYLDTAVKVTINDPADPTPYWLVATRRPRELAAVLARAPDKVTGHSLVPRGMRPEGNE
jgi:hypothetical protein